MTRSIARLQTATTAIFSPEVQHSMPSTAPPATGAIAKASPTGADGILTEAEIRAAVAYSKSRWPEEIRRMEERLND